MKQYKHKITGDLIEKCNESYYKLQSDGRIIPIRLIEQSNDWQEVKEYSIFTTEDGVEMYEQDPYIFVTPDWEILEDKANESSGKNLVNKYFAKYEAAKQYIKYNKPVFSKKQIEDAFYNTYKIYKDEIIWFDKDSFKKKLGI